jgi:hypothetical protein
MRVGDLCHSVPVEGSSSVAELSAAARAIQTKLSLILLFDKPRPDSAFGDTNCG